VVKTRDKLSFSGSARNARVQCRLQDQLGLLEGILVSKVPQELKEAQVPRQVSLADATKHPKVGLQQGKQALRPILMDLAAGIFLLGMVDVFMLLAFQRPIAAGRVGVEPTTRLHGEVGRLLHCCHGKILHGLYHDGPLAAHPRNNCRSVFVIMAPAGLALLAATTRPAPQRLFPAVMGLTLIPGGVIEFVRFNATL
jgi:hypothetical protein